jgi:hypothetical protein
MSKNSGHPEEFAKGNKVLVWGGLWKRNRKDDKFRIEFFQNYSLYAPKIAKFLEQLHFFFMPIEADKRLRERIESAIAAMLANAEGVIGGFQDKDVRYKPRTVAEQPIKIVMTFSKPIMGLSEDLMI